MEKSDKRNIYVLINSVFQRMKKHDEINYIKKKYDSIKVY